MDVVVVIFIVFVWLVGFVVVVAVFLFVCLFFSVLFCSFLVWFGVFGVYSFSYI